MPKATRSAAKHDRPDLSPPPLGQGEHFFLLVIYLHVSKLCLSQSCLDLFMFDGFVGHGTWLAHLPAAPAGVPVSQGALGQDLMLT